VDYLVTGARGQLGRQVLNLARERGASAEGSDLPEVAVDDEATVRRWIVAASPRYVIHCAAYTDVDGCEKDPATAERVNGGGTAHVAAACREAGAGLVYISTDFVFDGRGSTPYLEDHPTAPLSVYGRTKLLGEDAVLGTADPRFIVVRTSWVFGPGGRNFPAAILARADQGETLSVVDDQVGSPTMTVDLADAILDLAESGAAGGIYHAANAGHCSWHRFATDILAAASLGDVQVDAISSAELARPAERPAWSVLDCSKLATARGRPLPDYLDALQRYLQKERP
jgi:dTDP-4-dehydrorhamnose reductase